MTKTLILGVPFRIPNIIEEPYSRIKLKIISISLIPVRVKPITTVSIMVAILVALSVTNVSAISPYQSGYNHGLSDAQKAAPGLGGNNWYITQPEKGFAFHTQEFNRGYIDGFCSIAGSGAGSDANQATFNCPMRFSSIK